ncbi:hypothetical protein WN943_014591 [Citrus x changshan-huyou]
MASGSGTRNIVYGIGLGLAGKFDHEDCRKNVAIYFILNEVSFRKLRIRATGSLGRASSNLENSRLQTSKYLARNLLCQCSRIAITTMLQQQCYNNGFSICIVPDLFQFFSN